MLDLLCITEGVIKFCRTPLLPIVHFGCAVLRVCPMQFIHGTPADEEVRYSVIRGKPFKMKHEKTTDDHNAEMNRCDLLEWLNSGAAYYFGVWLMEAGLPGRAQGACAGL